MSIQPRRKRLLEKHVIAPSAARLCYVALGSDTFKSRQILLTKIIHLPVARNSGGGLSTAIYMDRVLLTFAQEFAPLRFEMPNQSLALHAAERETASRMTFLR
jgi:hypothetical protein